MQALVKNDTEAIKGILRQGSHADYISPSVTDGRVQPSARDLFLQVNAKVPESFSDPDVRRLNYDDGLGNILLRKAASISDYELIRLVLEKGADVTSTDDCKQTALHIACREKSLEIIKFLTEKSPAHVLDIPDLFGRTPLDVACGFNCPEVVQFLLSQGSSVGAKDIKRLPLSNALLINEPQNAIPIAHLLLDAGANVNHADCGFGSLLRIALEMYQSNANTEMQIVKNSTINEHDPYIDLCMLLIDRGCDVNATDSEGITALHVAVQAELENVVRKLLIFGSDIDRCDHFGDSPLQLAFYNGSQRLAALLITAGANLRAVDWEATLELWKGCENLNERHIQVLKYIIHESKQCRTLENLCINTIRNAEKDAPQLGLPPLLDIENLLNAAMQALVKNDTEAIKGILRQGSHMDNIFPSVSDDRVQVSARDLFLQVNTTVPENLERLNHFNYDDVIGNILLQKAAMISDYELIRLLVENGADVTSPISHGQTALHIVCQEGTEETLEIIKFLTEKSPAYILDDPDDLGRTPLDIACEFNCPDVVQFLLSQGSSVDSKEIERFPLLSAIIQNDAKYAIPIASLLLDAGANINHACDDLGTPLIAAVQKCDSPMRLVENSTASQNDPYVDLCMLLIDRGCDVNAVDSAGRTALHFAVQADLENLVRKLIISGSDIDRWDNFGDTPLHIACGNGSERLVNLLIISGANLRAQDWEATFKRWRRLRKLNERNTQLLKYIISKSEDCLALKSLCNITLRKIIRNVEKNAAELGLPPILVKRLQLKN
ncbi:Ankyrin-3, partial [Stegodyphus mimosarum]